MSTTTTKVPKQIQNDCHNLLKKLGKNKELIEQSGQDAAEISPALENHRAEGVNVAHKLLSEGTGSIGNFYMWSERTKKFFVEHEDFFRALENAQQPHRKLAREILSHMENINKAHKQSGGKKIFQLDLDHVYHDETIKLRATEVKLGIEPNCDEKVTKTILLMGITGAGKSSIINNIVNYVYGVSFEDEFRFGLIDKDQEISERAHSSNSEALSMTSYVTSYLLPWKPGCRCDFNLQIIDTPGFADSRGIERDEQTVEQMRCFLDSSKSPAEVSCVGFVVKASDTRITDETTYVIDEVLNMFSKSLKDNFHIFFTFADHSAPPALNTLKSTNVEYNKFFKFNNSAIYTDDEGCRTNWDFSHAQTGEFFEHIKGVKVTRLTETLKVLDLRQHLKANLAQLEEHAMKLSEKLTEIEKSMDRLAKFEGTADATINKPIERWEKRAAPYVAKNCDTCKKTCCIGCKADILGIFCMNSTLTGRCKVCPKKCYSEKHKMEKQMFYLIVESELQTLSVHTTKEQMIDSMKRQWETYNEAKERFMEMLKEISNIRKRLQELAMKYSKEAKLKYLDKLMKTKESDLTEDSKNRLEDLKKYRERYYLMENVDETLKNIKKELFMKQDEIDEKLKRINNKKNLPKPK